MEEQERTENLEYSTSQPVTDKDQKQLIVAENQPINQGTVDLVTR